jgi:hypothetical protein
MFSYIELVTEGILRQPPERTTRNSNLTNEILILQEGDHFCLAHENAPVEVPALITHSLTILGTDMNPNLFYHEPFILQSRRRIAPLSRR